MPSERFRAFQQKHLQWEQMAFLNRGSRTPELVALEGELDPLWEGMTEEEKEMYRKWPVRRKEVEDEECGEEVA